MKKFLTNAIKASLLIATISSVNAQVGINTDTPNDLTALDIQNQTDNGNIIPKGVMIPRMTEAQRASIDVSDKDQANSLWIYNTDEDCYNYYSKSDGEWQSLCGAAGRSVFTVDCGATKVNGAYIIENATNESNYVTVSVNVTKKGTWDMTATAQNSNGYSFTGSGLFTETGVQIVRLTAQGTPVNEKTDTLTISPSAASSAANCTFTVTVLANTASYALNCSSTVISGTYLKGTALTAANTIRMNVSVSSAGSYVISTPVTNGISFQASGKFTGAGTQEVTLIGTGTPTVNTDFPITINTNTTAGAATCSTTIPVTLPAMTYAIIGTDIWSWNTTPRTTALANLPANGLRIAGLTPAWTATTAADGAARLNSGGTQPDILLYFSYGGNAYPTDASGIIPALANYINKGGCVIYGYASSVAPSFDIALLNGIFGAGNYGTVQDQISTNDDNVYLISNFPNDPIINGPFGNLVGRYWGEDNGSTGTELVTRLPPNSVQICSASTQAANLVSVNPEYSVVWYNDSKNFVFFGDSTGTTTSNGSVLDGWPSYYSTTGLPLSKRYGNSYSIQYVYNSALELNAVVWALKKAADSGINPH